MKNECNIIRDILPLYVEDMVSADTSAFVEEHLEKCAECRAELEEMKNPNSLERVCSSSNDNCEKEVLPLKTLKKKWYRHLGMIVIYFIPANLAVIATLFYLLLGILGSFGAINPAVWFFVALLIVSAVLMSKGKWWGSLGGVIVGLVLIYMSTQYTGQVIDIERPLGIVFLVYYLICGILLYRNKK